MSTLERIRYDAEVGRKVARIISGNDALEVYGVVRNPGDGLAYWPCSECHAAYATTAMTELQEGDVVKAACSVCGKESEQERKALLLYNLALGHEMFSPAAVADAVDDE